MPSDTSSLPLTAVWPATKAGKILYYSRAHFAITIIATYVPAGKGSPAQGRLFCASINPRLARKNGARRLVMEKGDRHIGRKRLQRPIHTVVPVEQTPQRRTSFGADIKDPDPPAQRVISPVVVDGDKKNAVSTLTEMICQDRRNALRSAARQSLRHDRNSFLNGLFRHIDQRALSFPKAPRVRTTLPTFVPSAASE